MADTTRNQRYLGIDSNVLVAFLVSDHPDHELTKPLTQRKHALNPTVLHETYHTCVFKLRRRSDETIRVLSEYMGFSLCLPINSATVNLGLKFALEYHLGGRDALILASYASSKQLNNFITLDQSLLAIKQVRVGQRNMKIADPSFTKRKIRS